MIADWRPAAPGHGPSCGQAMVEFALVLVLFLGLTVAIFEGARLVATNSALGSAAADGARAGAFVPSSQHSLTNLDADVRAAVRHTTSFLGNIPDSGITICRRTTRTAACGTSVQSGSVMEVTVTYTFAFVPFAGGWLGQASMPLTGYHRVQLD